MGANGWRSSGCEGKQRDQKGESAMFTIFAVVVVVVVAEAVLHARVLGQERTAVEADERYVRMMADIGTLPMPK